MVEETLDFQLPDFRWMASPVEVDKTRDPLQVRAFRGKRVTTGPHIDAQQVKKAGGTGRNGTVGGWLRQECNSADLP